MVAPNYAAQRSELAKGMGLGQKSKNAALRKRSPAAEGERVIGDFIT